MRRLALLTAALATFGCATPPRDAYVGGSRYAGQAVGIGPNAAGEPCTQQPRTGGVDIFCAKWQQPSGEVTTLGPGGREAIASLATASPWRSAIDQRFACEPPRAATILDGAPTQVLACTRRLGGWPHVAMLASVDGTIYAANGILPTASVLQRAIAVLSGRANPVSAQTLPRSGADGLLASRLAAQSFGAGDIEQYDTVMAAGLRANLAESFAASEQAYRAALQLQRKALGNANPNTAVPMMRLALQISDQQRYPEADALFAAAAPLAPLAADPLAPAELFHARALDMINQGRWPEALALLRQADAAYAAQIPKDALGPEPGVRTVSLKPLISNTLPILNAREESALIGLIETRRYEAIALRGLGRTAESEAAIDQATAIASSQNLRQPALSARLARTAAATAEAAGARGSALSGYSRSVFAFTEALPGSRPVAETNLLRAAQLAARGDAEEALGICRQAVALLRELEIGTSIELLEPCLEVYRDAAKGASEQPRLVEMFEASQLVQGGVTAQQIALAAARLVANAKNPRVGEAIRRRQDAGLRVEELNRARDLRAAAARGERPDLDIAALPSADVLEAELPKAQAALADADAAVQVAAPEYGQLVQQVTSAGEVYRALGPGEAFASIVLAPNGCWIFVLRGDKITLARSSVNEREMTALVARFRAGVEEGTDASKPFDMAAASAIYAATLGQQAAALAGIDAVVVAPSGPLLAIPFAALLTGPAQQDHFADAPWLVRQMTIAHVPSPANFVALRKVARSLARQPWFGMGDSKPVTLGQAERTFPTASCAESARLFAGLPSLPLARRELDAARQLLGGATQDELLGGDYTSRAVERANLQDYRVLHFAAHALMPAELRCQDEPAIVTSAPPGATDASAALLKASDVTGLKLDADLVVLSACNTGSSGQPTGGESLSGLARAFFYAGARSMLVTHWAVNDQATAFLVADTLKHLRSGSTSGAAASLRLAQLDMLNGAGKTFPAELAHPYFWAPFSLIGEDGARRAALAMAARSAP